MYARKEHEALGNQHQKNAKHIFPPMGLFPDTLNHMYFGHYGCSHAVPAHLVSDLRGAKNQNVQYREEHKCTCCHVAAHCPGMPDLAEEYFQVTHHDDKYAIGQDNGQLG